MFSPTHVGRMYKDESQPIFSCPQLISGSGAHCLYLTIHCRHHAPTDNDANVMFAIIGHKIRSEEIKITNFYLTVPVASLVTSAVCIM